MTQSVNILRGVIESSVRLGEAIDCPASPYKAAAITLSALGLFFTIANCASNSQGCSYQRSRFVS